MDIINSLFSRRSSISLLRRQRIFVKNVLLMYQFGLLVLYLRHFPCSIVFIHPVILQTIVIFVVLFAKFGMFLMFWVVVLSHMRHCMVFVFFWNIISLSYLVVIAALLVCDLQSLCNHSPKISTLNKWTSLISWTWTFIYYLIWYYHSELLRWYGSFCDLSSFNKFCVFALSLLFDPQWYWEVKYLVELLAWCTFCQLEAFWTQQFFYNSCKSLQ